MNDVISANFIKPQVSPSGPSDADIMVVGEAPGANEVREGVPFVGSSGQELDRMLHDAGILRTDCFATNVARVRPPGNKIEAFYTKNTPQTRIAGPQISQGIELLKKEILTVRPKVIIALGDTALWALTGNRGIVKWRGSQLPFNLESHSCTVIPTYHPAAILRQWSWRFAGVIDLKRAAREIQTPTQVPPYEFLIRPSFSEAMEALNSIPLGIVTCDLETRGGHIACIGFGLSRLRAFCIPFMCVERLEGYWTPEEEFALVSKIQELFRNPGYKWIFQNGLYDVQYIARYWGVEPKVFLDTMLGHHVCYAGLPKGLDFLSSIYCDYHCYWKDEGKEWDPKVGEDQLWNYNCKDSVVTYECAGEIQKQIDQLKLQAQVDFQMRQFPAVFRMMHRGVRCDQPHKANLVNTLTDELSERSKWINIALGDRDSEGAIVPADFNIRSPKQMQELFYHELGLPVIKKRGTGRPTTDDAALTRLSQRNIILRPLIKRMQESRSIGVFLSTFALMRLDRDGRIRCSYNVGGTETFRYSSSTNAFGSGGNLQNIPAGDEDDEDHPSFLPNIKKIFVPDPGYEICDADLDRADAQVVAAEAEDVELLQMFREGVDTHLVNAREIFQNSNLTKGSNERQMAKIGVHATNYGISARNLAIALGITVRMAERFQQRWFAAHPGIREWQRFVENCLQTRRMVENKFGFRRYYFDRVEGLLPEALAWIPQSTVALVICTGLVRLHEQHPEIHPLLQVHDSLVTQYLSHLRGPSLRKIRDCMLVEIPYNTPLTIPVGFKISRKSWGDCEDYKLESAA